jgi:CheY-like chemotaxis protein
LQGEREHCLEHGMTDYITKPITLASVAGVLRRVIGDANR